MQRGEPYLLSVFRAPVGQPLYLFSVLPASCRQNEPVRDRKICRRDAGSTLDPHHEAPLNRYQPFWLPVLRASPPGVLDWRQARMPALH